MLFLPYSAIMEAAGVRLPVACFWLVSGFPPLQSAGARLRRTHSGRGLAGAGARDAGGSAGDGGGRVLKPWLSLLGMARKAGQVRLGEEAASQAVLDHKARLILIAADAGETTARRLKRLESDKLPVLTLPEKKGELGAAVGFVDVAAAAVCDLGFACAIAQKLAAEDEGCRDAAERLKARQSKAVRRKADTARHGKKSARRGR